MHLFITTFRSLLNHQVLQIVIYFIATVGIQALLACHNLSDEFNQNQDWKAHLVYFPGESPVFTIQKNGLHITR
jgi:hypothetical protein